MEKFTIVKCTNGVGEWEVISDSGCSETFDTRQEAKDYIYNKRPRWYWKTATHNKKERQVKEYIAKKKLEQCVNLQREILDIPKDFISDISDDKKRTYHIDYSGNNRRRMGSNSVNIKREATTGGDIRQSYVFSKNFSDFSRNYSGNDVGENLMGFVHQLDSLRDLRFSLRNTIYFSSIDSRLGDSRYHAEQGLRHNFPKADEYIDVRCDTYIETESGTKYVDLNRKSKGLLADAKINSDLQSELPMSFFPYNEKYDWNSEDKVKYSTRPFLKRTCQMTTKTAGRREWTLQVSPMWKERCGNFAKSNMGNRPLFPMNLSVYKKYDEKKQSYVELDWVKKEGKKLYKGNFVDFSFTKRTEANGYTDKNGFTKGYEFTPFVIPNLFLMSKTLPSGDVLHAVHEDIGKANRDLDKKLVARIANELEVKS